MWFIALLFEHPFVVPALLLALPSLLPTRSWVVFYAAALGTMFALVWAIEIYQRSQTDYQDHGVGAVVGFAIFLLLTSAFLVGLVLRFFLYFLVGIYRRKLRTSR